MPDPVTTTAAVAAQVGGAALGARASRRSARQQRQAAAEQLALQREMFNRQEAAYAPFRQAGLQAQNALMLGLGLAGTPGQEGYGALSRAFGAEDFQAEPGYQFRLDEGLKALNRQAAARGGTLSGSALKGTQRYAQDVASQEYQNAFNRYMENRESQLRSLAGLVNVGAGATQGIGGAAGQFGQYGGQTLADIGNARAAGTIGQANAYAGALGDIGNSLMTYGLLQGLSGGEGGGGRTTTYRGTRTSTPVQPRFGLID